MVVTKNISFVFRFEMLNIYCMLFVLIPIVSAELVDLKKFSVNFEQHEYRMKFERMEVLRYTKRFYNELSVVTYKYNRTTAVANLTFSYSVEIGNKMEVIIQAYKFASNEYRLFPVRFQVNLCTAIKANMGGLGQFGACGNYGRTNCYFLKNKVYHVCNWAPDEYRFPPGVPTGRYMVELQQMYYSDELLVARVYVDITRPTPIPT